jgi:hypothetical protein
MLHFAGVLLSLLLQLLYVFSCDDKLDCAQDAQSHEGEWVNCDACVCNNFDDYTDDTSACQTNADYYNCYIMQEINDGSVTWSCTTVMKTPWVIGFVFIALIGCSCCCGAIAACSGYKKNRQPEEVKIVLVNA